MRVEHWTATIRGREIRVRVACNAAGRPVDVHASWGAPGNDLGVALEAICLAASTAMRAGCPIKGVATGWRGQRFEPAGPTGDPLVPRCSSIVDYLARAIEARFPADFAAGPIA